MGVANNRHAIPVGPDAIGKVRMLPNTLTGIAIGLSGVSFGARIGFGDTAIRFCRYSCGRGVTLALA